MAEITEHVVLTLAIDSVGVPREGFGVAGLISHKAVGDLFPERYNYYSSLAEVLDVVDSDSPEGLAATALFSQSLRPERIAILRTTVEVIQKYELDAVAIDNLAAYAVNVEGEGFEGAEILITSGATATKEAIHDALKTALNAIVDKNFTVTFPALVFPDAVFTAANATEIFTSAAHGLVTGDGPFQVSNAGGALPAGLVALTDYWFIRIDANTFKLATSLANAMAGTNLLITTDGTGVQTLADVAGTVRPSGPLVATGNAEADWFSFEVLNPSRIAVRQTHTVTGLGEDLSDILVNSDGGFYTLIPLYPSKDYAVDLATWAEANDRTVALDVNETLSINSVVAGATDTLAALFALGFKNTWYSWHHKPNRFFSAGWMGRWLTTEPGAATPKFKTLAGIEASTLTTTQRTNLRNRRANGYTLVAGRNITWEGHTGSTEYKFMDVVRNLHWMSDEVVKGVFELLADAEIIPFTPEGIAQVQGAILGSMDKGVRQGVAAADPEPVVTVPDIDDIDDIEKSDRELHDAKFSFTLQGAVHKVFITGSISF